MSGEVIPFERKSPHLHGAALCLACGHEWVGVQPVGNKGDTLDCTKCGSAKGVFKRFVAYSGHPQWQCKACTGWLFTAILIQEVPTVACATCGELRNAMDLFNT